MAKRFFVRIGSEEKNIIFGGRGCRALRDASKDTSFRFEGGELYIMSLRGAESDVAISWRVLRRIG